MKTRSYFSKSGVIFTYKNNATRLQNTSTRTRNPHFYSSSLQVSETVRLDERLSNNERMLLADIVDLVKKKGYCYATNEYLAKLHHVSPRTITRWLRKLRELLYISIEIIKTEKKQIIERRIRIIDEFAQKGMEDNGIITRCFTIPPYRQNCRKNNIISKSEVNNSFDSSQNRHSPASSLTDYGDFDWLSGFGFDPLA